MRLAIGDTPLYLQKYHIFSLFNNPTKVFGTSCQEKIPSGGKTMTTKQPQQQHAIGMVGMGVMGRRPRLCGSRLSPGPGQSQGPAPGIKGTWCGSRQFI